MICKDGHATKKTSIVMHHAVSDLMTNWSDAKVAKWFSDVGRNRGYEGIPHSFHCDPTESYESFSQAQYCLHPYTTNGNKYGWRLTDLIKYPFENACWHASNWEINKSSIGIETAGTYTSKRLDEKALMLIADTFRSWDVDLGGWLYVYPHNKFSNTICPGLIKEQIPDLYDMFNDPDKWNEKLWPDTPPPTDPCKVYRDEIEILKSELKKCTEKSEDLDKLLTECNENNVECAKALSDEVEKYKALQKKHQDCMRKLKECKDSPSGCDSMTLGDSFSCLISKLVPKKDVQPEP